MDESAKDQMFTSLDQLVQLTNQAAHSVHFDLSGPKLEELERQLQEKFSALDRADVQLIVERLDQVNSLINNSIHQLSSRINLMSTTTSSSSFESAELSATVGQWARLRSFVRDAKQRLALAG
jgi:hypothetical protein